MPKENQTDPRNRFAPRYLPWLLGGMMLAAYAFTINPWVTLANLLPISKVSGFLWQPELYNPLLFLATLPFRALSPAHIPLALNFFSAVCAAVVLGLLARCVAIMPHDRTEMERAREKNDFAFLTTASAWIPPVLAVAMMGLQFGFWQNATSFTGEMLDLVVFAAIIWLLLEFRLDEGEGRLWLAALLYGAGMVENWAMLPFLPVFAAALIWLRGLEFFNVRFLARLAGYGLAGMSLILLLPIVGKFSGGTAPGFWEMLKPPLRLDWLVMKAIRSEEVRHNLALMSLTTFLPVLLMAIRWSASFGDSSRLGTALTNYMFYLIHAVVLGVCLWVMFDPPFSPGQLALGTPALTFYFLSALGIGYYCGYYLLVFGKKAVATKRNPNPLPALPGQFEMLSPLIYWGICGLAGVAAGTLLYKNLPQIRAVNDDTLLRYARLTEQSLPPGGGVLLSDGEPITANQQARTLLIQAALARSGRDQDFLVVDTTALNWAPYHRYLHKKSAQKWPLLVSEKDMGGINPLGLLVALNQLAKSNNLCYLNPSYGYYFELFYQEPHGLAYQMRTLPEDTLLPPPLSTNLIKENRDFWAKLAREEFPRLEKTIAPPPTGGQQNFGDWVLLQLHGQAEANPNALFVASLYSRALDFWGVQAQRAGLLPAAAECFATAQKINPDNIAAAINLEFNQALHAGTVVTINPNRATADQFGKYRSWNAVLSANGPFDEPSYCFQEGILCMENTFYGQPMPLMRQSIAAFNRVSQLAPDNLPARLWLAQHYLSNRLPAPALAALQDPLSHPARFGLTASNSTELNILAATAHFQNNQAQQGVELVELEISRHPDDNTLLTSAAKAYFMRGLYTNALRVINRRLARSPNDPEWVFGLGYAHLQMTNYNKAIIAFTRVMEISTNDATARFNRALAYLQLGRLDDARADYAALQSSYTNSYQVAFGLAEVAWRQHATNDAIRNYQRYLETAPTNSAEFQVVQERLGQLQKK